MPELPTLDNFNISSNAIHIFLLHSDRHDNRYLLIISLIMYILMLLGSRSDPNLSKVKFSYAEHSSSSHQFARKLSSSSQLPAILYARQVIQAEVPTYPSAICANLPQLCIQGVANGARQVPNGHSPIILAQRPSRLSNIPRSGISHFLQILQLIVPRSFTREPIQWPKSFPAPAVPHHLQRTRHQTLERRGPRLARF